MATPDPGLCGRCRHARRQRSTRGSEFLRCARADADPGFRRYPPLPVRACDGFQAPCPAGVDRSSPGEPPSRST